MTIEIPRCPEAMIPRKIINLSDYDEDSRLCCDCVTDQYLSAKIRAEGEKADCSFCDELRSTFSLGRIAELTEQAFSEHFERTSNEPSDWDYWRIKELDYEWDREGDQVDSVIAEIAGVDEDVAEVITKILEERHADWDLAKAGEETEFDRQSQYQRKAVDGNNRHREEWSMFERRIQNECRFLSRKSQGALDEVFAGIGHFVTRDNQPVIRKIGPATEVRTLFRARVFQSIEGLFKGLSRPDREVGPPPLGKAASGRMNAQGISVFYGALHPDTAVAEVRPPVGSHVVVAEFELLRPLRVLDISALKQILIQMSYFDPDHRPLLDRVAFLKELSGKITRPAMPEREHIDYLVTQVIADYLASEHQLDGLLYPSVQVAKDLSRERRTNIVLFHHASRTEEIQLPKGTDISVDNFALDEDGEDSEFVVFEDVPVPVMAPTNAPSDLPGWDFDPGIAWLQERPSDQRLASLRVILEQVSVHYVDAVRFSAKTMPVRRARRGPQPS
jgi:hypothetical protein